MYSTGTVLLFLFACSFSVSWSVREYFIFPEEIHPISCLLLLALTCVSLFFKPQWDEEGRSLKDKLATPVHEVPNNILRRVLLSRCPNWWPCVFITFSTSQFTVTVRKLELHQTAVLVLAISDLIIRSIVVVYVLVCSVRSSRAVHEQIGINVRTL